MPDGKGKYVWKNGDWYEGQWSRGKKDGAGSMHYKSADKDSLINGFWKKDVYAGKYEKPFIIYSKSKHVTKISCTKISNDLNELDIYLNSETGGNPTSMINADKTPKPDGEENPILAITPKPKITSIEVKEGSFENKIENDTYGKKIVYNIERTTFPFHAILNMGSEFLEIEFFEAGKWMLEITLAY